VGYQQPDDVAPAEKRGHHESGLTDIIGRVDVAMFSEQPIRDFAFTLERDTHQGGVALRIGGAAKASTAIRIAPRNSV
jgi:hypothetical protein